MTRLMARIRAALGAAAARRQASVRAAAELRAPGQRRRSRRPQAEVLKARDRAAAA